MRQLPLSSYALIAANLIPLIGVLFYDWDALLVLALFWVENVTIGLFTIVKIMMASGVQKDKSGIFVTLFFIFHYGLFCSVHGQFLTELIGYPEVSHTDYFAEVSFSLLALLADGAAVLYSFIENLAPAIWYGIGALVLSRLVSFIENFILRGEIFTSRVGKLMTEPYGQIIVLHAGIIFGAIILEKFNSPVWLLAVIVVLKIIVDFEQHRRRHNKKSRYVDAVKDI